MNENEQKTGKTSRFFEEKGFYIILFLCALAIGIAGYVLFAAPEPGDAARPEEAAFAETAPESKPSGTVISGRSTGRGAVAPPLPEEKAPTSGKTPAAVETLNPAGNPAQEKPAEVKPEEKPKAEPPKAEPETPKPTAPAAEAPTEKAPAPEAPAEKAPEFFVKPVAGDVLRNLSVTELVYDRTMGDWRTHNGADFAAAAGETVMAVADGTVTAVTASEFYGTVVVIDHGGGLESRYYGLAEQATVQAGDAVRAGDVIGSVSTYAHFEALEPVHLHLEMLKDGKYVDPLEYLGTKQ